jgi:hypothetical protein
MTTAHKTSWLGLIILVATSLAAIVYTRHVRQSEFRNKITTLTTELSAYQSNKEGLRHLMVEPRFQGLILHDNSPNEWVVETPIEFGATNWVLYVSFNNSTVSGLRVRSADSKNSHPKGAPADYHCLRAQ